MPNRNAVATNGDKFQEMNAISESTANTTCKTPEMDDPEQVELTRSG